jgi:hypothetical protein
MSLDQIGMTRRVLHDGETGHEVWQVTDGEFECVAPYMEIRAWTADDRYLIFTCNRTGTWQPYRLELATGQAAQLANVRNGNFRSIALSPSTSEVFCESGPTFVAVNIETLESRVPVDYTRFFGANPKGGGKGRTPVLNRDGSLIMTTWLQPNGRGAFVIAPTDGSDEFEIVEFPHDDMLPGHEQFCPGDDDVISFCTIPDRQNAPTETPERRAREWRMSRRTREAKPLVLMPPGFRATHCVWGATGERFYFHRKTVPTWVPTALCSVNRDAGDLRVYHETSAHKLGHSAISPDEKWIATDSQDFDRNILMLASTERDEQRLLCWPNTSIGSGRPDKRAAHLPPHTDRHTHPGFSATGRYVHYTSDASGRSQVYVVEVFPVSGG